MLGHRGVRLAVTNPELYRMQIEAIEQARAEVPADVSIMVPQVITAQEAITVKGLLKGSDMKVGVMMETVRACMRAGQLATEVDFFSFGTNDLTQAVFSFSREDAEKKFLSTYLRAGHPPGQPLRGARCQGRRPAHGDGDFLGAGARRRTSRSASAASRPASPVDPLSRTASAWTT